MAGHDEPECSVTFVRNRRSRWAGIPNWQGWGRLRSKLGGQFPPVAGFFSGCAPRTPEMTKGAEAPLVSRSRSWSMVCGFESRSRDRPWDRTGTDTAVTLAPLPQRYRHVTLERFTVLRRQWRSAQSIIGAIEYSGFRVRHTPHSASQCRIFLHCRIAGSSPVPGTTRRREGDSNPR
jgi:hypothetical protein